MPLSSGCISYGCFYIMMCHYKLQDQDIPVLKWVFFLSRHAMGDDTFA